MADEERSDKELGEQRELERALGFLRPAASRIDRDRFLFLAGQASAESVRPNSAFRRWAWPMATLLSSVAAVVLSVLLFSRPHAAGSREETTIADANLLRTQAGADVPAQSSPPRVAVTNERAPDLASPGIELSVGPTADETARALADGSNYPHLRSFVLAYGINALPEPAPIQPSTAGSATDDEPRTQREMLRQILKERAALRSSLDSAG
ncbi:MAG TPA: hypothetical protein VFG04_25165 [Planctomycetaceae bacterium]|jgi:hypothetical protein|nr:hypothetical protein [Planctomycetaceae bacterium]